MHNIDGNQLAKEFMIIGFDFGSKRIGVAIGQYPLASTQPIKIINANQGIPNWQEIDQLIKEWNPQRIAVGIPLHMDGNSQPITAAAKKFARRLANRYQLPVDEVDERLSTLQVKAQLQQAGKKNRIIEKIKLDHLAAQIILENWFKTVL